MKSGTPIWVPGHQYPHPDSFPKRGTTPGPSSRSLATPQVHRNIAKSIPAKATGSKQHLNRKKHNCHVTGREKCQRLFSKVATCHTLTPQSRGESREAIRDESRGLTRRLLISHRRLLS